MDGDRERSRVIRKDRSEWVVYILYQSGWVGGERRHGGYLHALLEYVLLRDDMLGDSLLVLFPLSTASPPGHFGGACRGTRVRGSPQLDDNTSS